MDEADIIENAFQIIFAFDEIVALGYRESVNLAQIRTFVEMDSHEEKVYQVSNCARINAFYNQFLYEHANLQNENKDNNYSVIKP